MKKGLIITFSIIGTLLLSFCSAYFIFYYILYKESEDAINYFTSTNDYTVEESNHFYTFSPTSNAIESSYIYYPGANISSIAYGPLCADLSSNGVTVYLAKVPLNIPFFAYNYAAEILSNNEDENMSFYIGGHSLGGVVASKFASKNLSSIKGVILLGSYSIYDISSLDNLSIYGEYDHILNHNEYEQFKGNLGNFKEEIIPGGNHANFGIFKNPNLFDKGLISDLEQIEYTSNVIVDFLSKK